MRYWVVSPNVSSVPAEQPLWEQVIFQKGLALMGWDEEHEIGARFKEEISIGDFILIAQGANRNKRLFIGGLVASNAVWGKLEGTPSKTYSRKLAPVLNKQELNNLRLDFTGTAYGDADRIPALYELHPSRNEADKRIATQLNNALTRKIEQMKRNEIIELLKYKKQIILQGPPGTGKTKMAKELAQALCNSSKGGVRHTIIDKLEIQRLLNGVDRIKTKSGKDLTIVSINDGLVQVKTEDSQVWSPSYNKIIESYNSQLFDRDGRTGGFTPYEDAIAKYLYEHHNTAENEMSSAEIGQVSLVQFHPSYSYEDFVRGIVAKPNEDGDGVLYEAEDKLIAKIANEALDNYRLSRVIPEHSSKLISVQNDLERFIRHVQDSIADSSDQKYPLTDDVYLFSSDATRFKYKGDNWVAHSKGLNMKYSELQKIIAAGVTERAQVKNLPDVEELTRQHATYFFNTYKKFQEFVANNPAQAPLVTDAVPLKNYVLIIDEINRANLSSVLGELIYALEYREEPVESLYAVDGNNSLILPPNLYIIGTMNTADRSVGHIDYAIRRRLAFVDVLPEILPSDFEKALFEKVSSLFVEDLHASPLEASEHLSSEFKFKDVWLGHSYFIKKKDVDSRIRLKYEIIPILEEYIKDGVLKDTDAVAKIVAELESIIA